MDRKEYEYHIEVIPAITKPEDVATRLTALGICGWQLVTVQGDRYYLERPR